MTEQFTFALNLNCDYGDYEGKYGESATIEDLINGELKTDSKFPDLKGLAKDANGVVIGYIAAWYNPEYGFFSCKFEPKPQPQKRTTHKPAKFKKGARK